MNRQFMRQAQELTARLNKIQEELANTDIETTAGGGAVKVTITGQQKIKAIKISPDAVDPKDISLLEDLVLAVVNEALEKSQKLAQERMAGLTGGLKIPGLM